MNNVELEKEIKRLVHALRYEKGYVCVIDILIGLEYLSKKDYEDWRFGRIDYLEKACKTNLSKLTFIVKSMKKFAKDLKLAYSLTVYSQYGKGISHRLKFCISGNKNIEDAYATHYIDKERINELKINKTNI